MNKIKNNKRIRENDYFSEENEFVNFTQAYKRFTKLTISDLKSPTSVCFLTGYCINKEIFNDIKKYFKTQSFLLENVPKGDDEGCITLRVMTTRDGRYAESIKKRSEDDVEKRVIDYNKLFKKLNLNNLENKEIYIGMIEHLWNCFINIIGIEEGNTHSKYPSIKVEVKYLIMDELIAFTNTEMYEFSIHTQKNRCVLIEMSIIR